MRLKHKSNGVTEVERGMPELIPWLVVAASAIVG
jgi:hypothetical protein